MAKVKVKLSRRGPGRDAREALNQWLIDQRFSVAELAEKLELSRFSIYLYMHGKRRPSLETAVKIEGVTGIPAVSWIR